LLLVAVAGGVGGPTGGPGGHRGGGVRGGTGLAGVGLVCVGLAHARWARIRLVLRAAGLLRDLDLVVHILHAADERGDLFDRVLVAAGLDFAGQGDDAVVDLDIDIIAV